MEESLLVNHSIIINFIFNFNLEDVEGSGDGEKINKIVNQLTVSSNDVGESAAECQGVLHLNVAP